MEDRLISLRVHGSSPTDKNWAFDKSLVKVQNECAAYSTTQPELDAPDAFKDRAMGQPGIYKEKEGGKTTTNQIQN